MTARINLSLIQKIGPDGEIPEHLVVRHKNRCYVASSGTGRVWEVGEFSKTWHHAALAVLYLAAGVFIIPEE